eukprot:scaffold7075_cov274-Pinguiococcus_pyrenoidosus.AAC.16
MPLWCALKADVWLGSASIVSRSDGMSASIFELFACSVKINGSVMFSVAYPPSNTPPASSTRNSRPRQVPQMGKYSPRSLALSASSQMTECTGDNSEPPPVNNTPFTPLRSFFASPSLA